MDLSIALQKATHYCAIQERAVSEVTSKLYTWKVPEQLHQEIINYLIENNYIDHKRFATIFAQSKLRNNQWGKRKISYALQQKQINREDIEYGLQSIDDEDYFDVICKLIESKQRTTKGKNPQEIQYKVINYMMGKGFDIDLIKKAYQLEI